jgi:hypothetical protein
VFVEFFAMLGENLMRWDNHSAHFTKAFIFKVSPEILKIYEAKQRRYQSEEAFKTPPYMKVLLETNLFEFVMARPHVPNPADSDEHLSNLNTPIKFTDFTFSLDMSMSGRQTHTISAREFKIQRENGQILFAGRELPQSKFRRQNNSISLRRNQFDKMMRESKSLEQFNMLVDMHPYDMVNDVGSGGDMKVDITF